MTTRYVSLPESGFNAQGHKPENVTVTEVPDSDLKALVDALCEGLGLGEGPTCRPAFSRNYRQLLKLAVDRDLRVPASMVTDAEGFRKAAERPAPHRGGIIDLD